ncbi:MAG: thiamine biosynthesis lipoprotein [Bacteroidia bacterium]|jgi:thiamine biosynthesis lipoprotein
MKIGFGAIGKGYAANRAAHIIQNMAGIVGGVVNASGDLMAWGENGKNDGWSVQIADPKNVGQVLGYLSVENSAVVTSGNYEKYFMSKGIRYAHIINPKTGYPTHGIKSVTVICPDVEIADALATSIFVLGDKEGLILINSLDNIECIIVTDSDELLSSNNLNLNYY